MKNKIIFLALVVIIVAAIIPLVGIYLTKPTSEESTKNLVDLEDRIKKLEWEIESLNKRISPYIYGGEAVGYVIEFENGVKFYFAGDTGLSSDLRLIGEYYKPDVAFLPIGNIYTTGPRTAAYATILIKPSTYVVPTHYGSFPELTHDPKQFFEELKKYDLEDKYLEFKVGEEREILGIKVEWLGHNHWLLETPNGTRILIDPEVKYNPDFPTKYRELVQLKDIDLILVTHGHFDTMTLSDLRKWGDLFDPIFITPYELGIWLKSRLPAYKILALGQGSRISKIEMLELGVEEEKVKEISNIVINVVPAAHSSSITPVE
ncbi:MAG TPA: MBL fold metallo-hydrolase [Candidatus Altiarchaeales archaeon]|nr:MBL fold metallo-hydrolase [Candidatus Altiarchaeales archaeon]